MKWIQIAVLLLASSSVAFWARADERKPAAAPPEGPPKPGVETKKLGFFIGAMSGAGKVEAGAFGPGSPALTSKAKSTCKWTVDDLWVQCEVSDNAGSGKDAQTWLGHMLIGWDFNAKSYRSVGVDNQGSAFDLVGRMDGKKFILESAREVTMMGVPVKFRFTYDTTDPKTLRFTDERSQKGGPYQLAETILFKKAG